MHVKEFNKIIAGIAAEVDCDGGTASGIHKIPSHVEVWVEGDEENYYELVGIETDRINCGCAVGLTLCLRARDEDLG